jgi:hypothetical protein
MRDYETQPMMDDTSDREYTVFCILDAILYGELALVTPALLTRDLIYCT